MRVLMAFAFIHFAVVQSALRSVTVLLGRLFVVLNGYYLVHDLVEMFEQNDNV